MLVDPLWCLCKNNCMEDVGEVVDSGVLMVGDPKKNQTRWKIFVVAGVTVLMGAVAIVGAQNLSKLRQSGIKAAGNSSITELKNYTGLDVTSVVSGVVPEVNNLGEGVYEVKIANLGPGGTDGYKIIVPEKVGHVYGAGQTMMGNAVELEDFVDNNFSIGHCATVNKGEGSRGPTMVDFYEEDNCGLRTPIFVLPTKNMLVAYFQPELKRVQLDRSTGKTTVLTLAKREDYPKGGPAALLIIKMKENATMADAYKAFYSYRTKKGMAFKKPLFQIYGINWETWNEVWCSATKQLVLDAWKKFEDKGIKFSVLSLGSGYWASPNVVACPESTPDKPLSNYPASDSLAVSEAKYGGYDGLNSSSSGLFTQMIGKGIFPMVAMRERIQIGTTDVIPTDVAANTVNCLAGTGSCNNTYKIQQEFMNKLNFSENNGNMLISANPNDIWTHYQYETDNTGRFNLLNLRSDAVVNGWVQLTRNAYGKYMGVKQSIGAVNDIIGLLNRKKAVTDPVISYSDSKYANIPDDIYAKMYGGYTKVYGNQFVMFGSSGWFDHGDDAIWPGGVWKGLKDPYTALKDDSKDKEKYVLDSAMEKVISGYEQMNGGSYVPPTRTVGSAIIADEITDEDKKQYAVRTTKNYTFFPVVTYSYGFWHVKNADGTPDTPKQNAMIFAMKLRGRLQQYMFDKANDWYVTGVPTMMRPLFMDYPKLEKAYEQYTYQDSGTTATNPRNEYMMGNALLVRPIYSNATDVTVYFPPGVWKPLIPVKSEYVGAGDTGSTATYSMGTSLADYPVFLKEGEILLLGNDVNPDQIGVYVYLNQKSSSSEYTYYSRDGVSTIKFQSYKDASGNVRIKSYIGSKVLADVAMTNDPYGKGFKYLADITALVPPACISWWNMNINGCSRNSDFRIDPMCKIETSTSTVKMSVWGAKDVKLMNTAVANYCTKDLNWSTVTSQKYSTSVSNWPVPTIGDNKVCGEFSNGVGDPVYCGGVITRTK